MGRNTGSRQPVLTIGEMSYSQAQLSGPAYRNDSFSIVRDYDVMRGKETATLAYSVGVRLGKLDGLAQKGDSNSCLLPSVDR